MHYGIFWFVHGVFVFTLPLFAAAARVGEDAPADFGALPASALLLGGIGLAVSHLSSFFLNYVGRRNTCASRRASRCSVSTGGSWHCT